MSERKLAHIERVISVEPIPGADKIEVATVLGWHCVVAKGEVKPGDLCIYVEIDSVVPQIPYFKFMEQRKYRVKTIKLRGQISQGLIIPITIDTIINIVVNQYTDFNDKIKEGADVTDALGITKWVSPSEREEEYTGTPKKKHNFIIKFLVRFELFRKIFHKKGKCSFPSWLSRTDEERIQNIPWILKDKQPMVVTEKIDGQSATYWVRKTNLFGRYEFGICSRTIRKFEHAKCNWSECAKQLDIKNKLMKYAVKNKTNICIQGELVCQKVQKGRYVGFTDSPYDLFVFNVIDINNKRKFNADEMVAFCNSLGFKHVPLVNIEYTLPDTVDDIVKYSMDKSVVNPNIDREGIVVRSYDQKISFKVINPNYLLKNED